VVFLVKSKDKVVHIKEFPFVDNHDSKNLPLFMMTRMMMWIILKMFTSLCVDKDDVMDVFENDYVL
jgi:hypothetical protein